MCSYSRNSVVFINKCSGRSLPLATYSPPWDSFKCKQLPSDIKAHSWECINLLDINQITIARNQGGISKLLRRRSISTGGLASMIKAHKEKGSLAMTINESFKNMSCGPDASCVVCIYLGVGAKVRKLKAMFKNVKQASRFCSAIRNNILAIQKSTPVLWEGWIKRSAGLLQKKQFLQLRPSGLYFYGRPSPQVKNLDVITLSCFLFTVGYCSISL